MSRNTWDRINLYLPLFCGCVIYFFFKRDIVLRKFEDFFPLFSLLRSILFIDFSPKTVIGLFFMNHLCDVLWAYSLSWSCNLAMKKLATGVVMALVFCAINEFAQLTPYICATFDWLDLLYEILAIIFSTAVFYITRN